MQWTRVSKQGTLKVKEYGGIQLVVLDSNTTQNTSYHLHSSKGEIIFILDIPKPKFQGSRSFNWSSNPNGIHKRTFNL
jgi:hypothetical protein